MKIKRERQVRLDELLQIIWSNPSKYAGTIFKSHKMFPAKVQVSVDGCGIKSLTDVGIGKSDLFPITEEVEIDEETPINLVYRIKTEKAWQTFDKNETPINRIINTYKRHPHAYLGFIYLQNDDGSIGELIWKDGELVD